MKIKFIVILIIALTVSVFSYYIHSIQSNVAQDSTSLVVIDDCSPDEASHSHGSYVTHIAMDTLFADIPVYCFDTGDNFQHYSEKLNDLVKFHNDNKNHKIVINLSFGSRSPDIIEFVQLLPLIASDRVLIVAAAGNDDSPYPFFPAAYRRVISVGAANPNGQKTAYSNYGNWVTIFATPPEYKEFIASTWTEEYGERVLVKHYQIQAGTSFAAPKVAAAAASIWAYYHYFSSSDIENFIYTNSKSFLLRRDGEILQNGIMLDIDNIIRTVSPNLANALLWKNRLLVGATFIGLPALVCWLLWKMFIVPHRNVYD